MMALGRGFSQWLAAARLLPPRQRADELLAGSDDLASAFKTLAANWEQLLAGASSPQVRRRAEGSIATLRHCQDRAAEYWTAGDPRTPNLVANWLGNRDWWWSGAAPSGHRIAIVSSRLPRLLEPHGPWLRALRAAIAWAHERGAIIVAGRNTAGSELALRGAVRRGLTTVAIRCCDLKVRSIQTWAKQWAANLKHSPGTGAIDLWALPVDMASAGPEPEPPSELYSVPENDRAAFAWADELIVLALRAGGNLHTLLRHRFAQPNARVFLLDLPGLQPARIRDELVPLGAMIWSPEKENSPKSSPLLLTTNSQSAIRNPRSPVPVPPGDGWAFLTHCTRACVGPWPDQPRDDYLDSLLDGRSDSDHSAFAALLRIATRRRLVASSQAIRGRYRVVSFTAAPLAELPRLRVFRSHRGRWDFEPYGICIRRQWLEQRGVRPVQYSSEQNWGCLPEADRPFFQLTPALASRGEREPSVSARTAIDWTVEREWRHLGDLDLSELCGDDVLLFVPDAEKARILLEFGPWPVTVYQLSGREIQADGTERAPQ